MQRIIFDKNAQSYFAESGLKSFDDFFYYDADLDILNNSKRYVNSVSFGEDSRKRTFFIKRFGYCHIEDIFLSIANFGRVCSQAACEYKNATYLLKKGFATYRPVCFGEQTIFGIEKRSFVVTEKVSGESLDCFVAQNFERLERREKERILKDLGQAVRKIHNCGISLPDLYIWHLFITKSQNGGYEFAVIDLHRMKYKITNRNEKIRNLARLDYSLRDEYFDEKLRRVLIKAYSCEEIDSLYSDVRRGSARLLRRRKPKLYTKSLSE